MRKKKTIDEKKLIKMIQDGLPQKEIMEKFGFKTSTQFKIAYLNAAMGSDMVPQIKSGRVKVEKELSREVSVSKRGSLIIRKPLVDDMGFKEGDTFVVRKTKAGVSLKKAEEGVKS